MLVKTYCAAVNGLDVNTVTCEVSMSRGVQVHLTGLADTAVKESYDRIKAALTNNGIKMPTMERSEKGNPRNNEGQMRLNQQCLKNFLDSDSAAFG